MHLEYHYLSKAIGNGICSLFFLMMSLIGETMGYFQLGPGMAKIDSFSPSRISRGKIDAYYDIFGACCIFSSVSAQGVEVLASLQMRKLISFSPISS